MNKPESQEVGELYGRQRRRYKWSTFQAGAGVSSFLLAWVSFSSPAYIALSWATSSLPKGQYTDSTLFNLFMDFNASFPVPKGDIVGPLDAVELSNISTGTFFFLMLVSFMYMGKNHITNEPVYRGSS